MNKLKQIKKTKCFQFFLFTVIWYTISYTNTFLVQQFVSFDFLVIGTIIWFGYIVIYGRKDERWIHFIWELHNTMTRTSQTVTSYVCFVFVVADANIYNVHVNNSPLYVQLWPVAVAVRDLTARSNTVTILHDTFNLNKHSFQCFFFLKIPATNVAVDATTSFHNIHFHVVSIHLKNINKIFHFNSLKVHNCLFLSFICLSTPFHSFRNIYNNYAIVFPFLSK